MNYMYVTDDPAMKCNGCSAFFPESEALVDNKINVYEDDTCEYDTTIRCPFCGSDDLKYAEY